MTRRQPLRVLLPNTVSHAVMDYANYPVFLTVELEPAYYGSDDAALIGAPQTLSFLAWVQLWLRLALGLETGPGDAHQDFTTFEPQRIQPKQVKLKALKTAPAHNLAAIMRFAPDAAGLGLTLNQYRERFTRLSAMGRIAIYWQFLRSPMSLRRFVRGWLRVRGAMGMGRDMICGAILSPD